MRRGVPAAGATPSRGEMCSTGANHSSRTPSESRTRLGPRCRRHGDRIRRTRSDPAGRGDPRPSQPVAVRSERRPSQSSGSRGDYKPTAGWVKLARRTPRPVPHRAHPAGPPVGILSVAASGPARADPAPLPRFHAAGPWASGFRISFHFLSARPWNQRLSTTWRSGRSARPGSPCCSCCPGRSARSGPAASTLYRGTIWAILKASLSSLSFGLTRIE